MLKAVVLDKEELFVVCCSVDIFSLFLFLFLLSCWRLLFLLKCCCSCLRHRSSLLMFLLLFLLLCLKLLLVPSC